MSGLDQCVHRFPSFRALLWRKCFSNTLAHLVNLGLAGEAGGIVFLLVRWGNWGSELRLLPKIVSQGTCLAWSPNSKFMTFPLHHTHPFTYWALITGYSARDAKSKRWSSSPLGAGNNWRRWVLTELHGQLLTGERGGGKKAESWEWETGQTSRERHIIEAKLGRMSRYLV